jgi:multidrug transporter EmrE-like cation transporter
VTWLLDPRLNLAAGALISITAFIWTVLSITLTTEPANVLAMSGVALILAGVTMMQNALTMRKVEVTSS